MAFTFRPSDAAEKAIEQIKKEADIATSSKALEYILHQFPVMQNELKGLYADLDKAEQELRKIKMTVASKAESDLAYNKLISELVSK